MDNNSKDVSRPFAGKSGSCRLVVLGFLLATLVLTACAKSGVPGAAPTSTAPTSTAVTRVDCGTFVLSQNEKTPAAAYRCFIKAVESRRPALLKETGPTTEGDPIPVTFVADGSGKVEVLTDSRKDKFGAKVVTREVCTGPIIMGGGLMFTTCTEGRPVG